MGLIFGLVSPLYYLCDHSLQKIANKFLAPLIGKVWFGVWIDILPKEKFANLNKKFLLFSCFYLFLICILYTSIFFYFVFFYKVLSIMSNEEMNELFYSL